MHILLQIQYSVGTTILAFMLSSKLTYHINCNLTLNRRHNEWDGVSNNHLHYCLLNRYLGTDQRKHQSFASLASAWGIRRWPVNSPHKGPVTRKMFPFWWRHHVLVTCQSVLNIPFMVPSLTLPTIVSMTVKQPFRIQVNESHGSNTIWQFNHSKHWKPTNQAQQSRVYFYVMYVLLQMSQRLWFDTHYHWQSVTMGFSHITGLSALMVHKQSPGNRC